MIKKKIRIFEGFAGYGGGSFGLKRLKENMPDVEFEVVAYSEFDKYASALFDANHKDKDGNPLKNWGDITKIIISFIIPSIGLNAKVPSHLFIYVW